MSDQNISQQLLNQQLDEYRLDAILGEGGMACVYRGFDVRLKRPAAIKVIQAPFRGQKDYIARFEREAQAIAQLRHPNIVGIYRYGEVEGLLYIAMEYIEGVDLEIVLADYIERGKFIPPQKISRTIRQLGQALDYAHSKGVIHRDVKPSNVMLDEQGNVILTDFGLVLIDDNTRGEIFGTPYYIAPEQAVSSAKAVPQSDLYAVGVILYEMLTGSLPFMASHPYDVALLHVSEPPPPPRTIRPDLSPELEGVVLKAMAKKPEDRYPTGAALADAVDQALFNAFSSRSGRSFSASMVLRLAGSEPPKSQAKESPTDDSPPVETPTPHPEPREGKVMIQRYVMRNIHSLLMALTADYSEEDLRQLYSDLPEFKPVQHQLVHSRGKGDLVRRLLEYAEQTMQVDELLGLAKEHNPELYQRYEPYYEVITRARELTGQTLGKFSIVERLGRGGMAEVYKAFQPGLARYVALKVIHPHLIDDEEFLERFESEAMAVANLRHPHIIQVFDFDREEDRYYMAMEFVDGPTLESMIRNYKDKNQPFPLAEAIKIFKDLGSAIDYAHSRGMIHRDLKPSNIMFTPRNRLVLTDFGIAHMANMPSYTTANAIVGTPAYMSPEQAKGEPVTERSDIYSLGVMLYELSTGHLPFEGETPLAIIVKLIDGTFPRPSQLNPGLPPAVEQVILRALDKNPDSRYPTAGEFAEALEMALALGPQALALSQLERSQPQEKDPDATLMLKAEEYTPSQNKGIQKAEIPVIKIDSPKPATPEPRPQTEPGGSVVNISGNTGQLIFGGGHVIQMGNVSGGTININAGARPSPAARPAALPDLIAGLKKRIAVEAPPAKQEAAQQYLAELEEALTATPPDQETLALLKHWFKKHVPSVAEELDRVIALG